MENTKKIIAPIFLGLIYTYLIVSVLSIISGTIIYYSQLTEAWIRPFSLVIPVVALLIGGFKAGKTKTENGLLQGFIVGIIFILIMGLCSAPINFSLLATKAVYCLLASSIGGILGVK